MHIDNVDLASWQVQLRGAKTWYLAPPPECWATCHGVMQVHYLLTISKYLDWRYLPTVFVRTELVPHQNTMYPGDVIVVNTNIWFHSTKVTISSRNLVLDVTW